VEAAGVECRGILDSGRPSGTAVIGVDRHGENQIIVASGANLDVDAGQVTDGDLAADVTLLCQNEVRPESTFALIAKAKTKGARTVLNLAPAGAVPAAVLDALDILRLVRASAPKSSRPMRPIMRTRAPARAAAAAWLAPLPPGASS
jgi:ribokinase